jgi:hypothetical protein
MTNIIAPCLELWRQNKEKKYSSIQKAAASFIIYRSMLYAYLLIKPDENSVSFYLACNSFCSCSPVLSENEPSPQFNKY